mmetsp:Transcript_8563/g.25474  ORF Transcript_8563/g.25474 Transcript_8563/m.25474 type:complete len:247 (-) Transcript_8563:1609-2349(-)
MRILESHSFFAMTDAKARLAVSSTMKCSQSHAFLTPNCPPKVPNLALPPWVIMKALIASRKSLGVSLTATAAAAPSGQYGGGAHVTTRPPNSTRARCKATGTFFVGVMFAPCSAAFRAGASNCNFRPYELRNVLSSTAPPSGAAARTSPPREAMVASTVATLSARTSPAAWSMTALVSVMPRATSAATCCARTVSSSFRHGEPSNASWSRIRWSSPEPWVLMRTAAQPFGNSAFERTSISEMPQLS